eukprot:scaffold38535_cov57-Phaeocystis_antarctica.AAC.2
MRGRGGRCRGRRRTSAAPRDGAGPVARRDGEVGIPRDGGEARRPRGGGGARRLGGSAADSRRHRRLAPPTWGGVGARRVGWGEGNVRAARERSVAIGIDLGEDAREVLIGAATKVLGHGSTLLAHAACPLLRSEAAVAVAVELPEELPQLHPALLARECLRHLLRGLVRGVARDGGLVDLAPRAEAGRRLDEILPRELRLLAAALAALAAPLVEPATARVVEPAGELPEGARELVEGAATKVLGHDLAVLRDAARPLAARDLAVCGREGGGCVCGGARVASRGRGCG